MRGSAGIKSLYNESFFIGNAETAGQQDEILGHLDEEAIPQLSYLDDYDSQVAKQRVMNTVNTAFHAHQQQTQQFDSQIGSGTFSSTESQRITLFSF